MGYAILPARDSDEGLALLARHHASVSLLITDVVLPRMGGRELATRALALRPGLPVLYISGYAPDEELRKAAEERRVAFLQKPFLPDQLARALRTLLE
jgi:CheY-like chemotaxis protein